MALQPLIDLEHLLCRYVKGRYFPRAARAPVFTAADLHFFARGVAEVSAAFTSERAALPKNYFNRKEFRSGYLLYFVLSNFPKAWNCLEQIDAAKRFADRDTVRLLDLGAGPGTASLAALAYWKAHAPRQKLHVTAIDQNPEILHDARALFSERARTPPPPGGKGQGEGKLATCETRTADLGWKNLAQALRRERFDIVIAMNVLNESGDLLHRVRLVNALLTYHLAPTGVLILIEPGLQRTTRELMALRDLLLCHFERSEESSAPHEILRSAQDDNVARSFTILAPCLHHNACPMRKQNARDWCHFYLDWDRPKIIADLDRLIGNKKEYLKFSYLILCHPEPQAKDPAIITGSFGLRPQDDKLFRVVSAPLHSKGKTELLLCPAEGNDTLTLHRITRRHPARAGGTTDLDRLHRGDIVAVRGEVVDLVKPFATSTSR